MIGRTLWFCKYRERPKRDGRSGRIWPDAMFRADQRTIVKATRIPHALQAAKVKPQYSADQEYRDVNESLPIGRAGLGLPGDVPLRGFSRGTK